MKNTSGFTHWIIVILISIMAVGLVGAAWYYEENKDKTETVNTTATTNTNVNAAVNAIENTNAAANTNTAANANLNANTNVENVEAEETSETETKGTTVTKTFTYGIDQPSHLTTLNEYSIATAAQVRKPTGITLSDIQVELYDSDLLDIRYGSGRVTNIKCNSDYCLMTISGASAHYRVLRFKDGNFTDLSDQLPNFATEGYGIRFFWNGSYWLVTSDSELFKYDGFTFTPIDLSLTSTQRVSALDWNGSYWLVAVSNPCCVYTNNTELLQLSSEGIVTTRQTILSELSQSRVDAISWGDNSWLIAAHDPTTGSTQQEPYRPEEPDVPVFFGSEPHLLVYSGSGEPDDITALMSNYPPHPLGTLLWDGLKWLMKPEGLTTGLLNTPLIYSYDGSSVTDITSMLINFDTTSINTIHGRPDFYVIVGYTDPVANVVQNGTVRDLSGYFAMNLYSGTTYGDQVIIGGESELEVLTFAYELTRVYVSKQINQNDETITAVTLSPVHEIPNSTSITYEASNNNGVAWHVVKPDVEYTFSTKGSVLLWRTTLTTGNTKKTPSISSITIRYTK